MDINSMVAAIAAFVDKVEKLEQRIAELEERGTVDATAYVDEKFDDLKDRIEDLSEKIITDYDLDDRVQEIVRGMSFTIDIS